MARHDIAELMGLDRGFDAIRVSIVWPDPGVRTDHVDDTGSGRRKKSPEP